MTSPQDLNTRGMIKAFEGDRLLHAGDYQGAIKACTEAIRLSPGNMGVRRTLANAYLKLVTEKEVQADLATGNARLNPPPPKKATPESRPVSAETRNRGWWPTQITIALRSLAENPAASKFAFMGKNIWKVGDEQKTAYRYLFGRVQGGILEFHRGPNDRAELTKHGIESRLSDLEQGGWRTPVKTFSTENRALASAWVDQYFLGGPYQGDYQLQTYISKYQDDRWRRDFSRVWDYGGKVAMGLLVLFVGWAIAQVVFLGWQGSPSSTAELMFVHREPGYVAFLALHAFAGFLALIMLLLEVRHVGFMSWHGLGKELHQGDQELGATLGAILMVALVLMFLIPLPISSLSPQYEVFVDMPSEEVVRRDTHLLPFGESQNNISFGSLMEIQIMKVIDFHGEENNQREQHYRLNVVTKNGEHIEIGWSGHDDSSHRKIFSLAQDISDGSGAPLNEQ